MDWVFVLYREHLEKGSKSSGKILSSQELEAAFHERVQNGSLKILVQEPWMGTIRFKALARHPMTSPDIQRLYENPMEFLLERYGGGKFKVNFYEGMNFVATRNFKPQGEPLWVNLPELVED